MKIISSLFVIHRYPTMKRDIWSLRVLSVPLFNFFSQKLLRQSKFSLSRSSLWWQLEKYSFGVGLINIFVIEGEVKRRIEISELNEGNYFS